MSHTRALLITFATSTASLLVACAPPRDRWRWRAALLALGLLLLL